MPNMSKAPYLFFRSLCERILALITLLLLAPLLVLIALLVCLDGGAPLFCQRRLGKDARPFYVIKFRTMLVNADQYLDAQGQPTRERVTFIGSFLRRFSLDELPQLLNVVLGQMNLIGPRPLLPSYYPYLLPSEMKRFAIRPGLSGLAQILCRNSMPWSKRLVMDRYYVQRISARLDLFILWQTFRVILGAQGYFPDRHYGKEDDLTQRPILREAV